MNRKLLPILCCALLCAFAGLFLSSCWYPQGSSKIAFSYGTESLKRNQVLRTTNNIHEKRPTTLKQMCDLLGSSPQSTYTDEKGKYCVWIAYEEGVKKAQTGKGGFQTATAYCLVDKNEAILKYCIYYYPYPYDSWGKFELHALGDQELHDFDVHPGAEKAWLQAFREREVRKGLERGQEVVFSPSGRKSHFLVPGSYVKEWVGETPNVGYTIPQGQQPLVQSQPQLEPQQQLPPQTPAQQQQSSSKSLIDTANTAIKLIKLFR